MDPKNDPRIVTLLIIAISALVAAIVALALYIRSIHNKNMKAMLSLTEKAVEAITKVDATIAIQTKSNELTSAANLSAITSFDRAVNNLHTLILQSTRT